MTNYIRSWYWAETRAHRRPNVILGVTADEELFGYGAWNHRDVTLDGDQARIIFVPWFGIQQECRGARTPSGEHAAGVLYATVEHDASTHSESVPDMPIMLDCHVDNDRGLAFWESRGFEAFDVVESPSGRYHRMRR